MKKHKSIIRFLVFALIAGMVLSCTDKFDDYNTDKSGATDEEGKRDDYILRAALIGMQAWVVPVDDKQVNTFQFTDCLLGGSFGGYLADSNSGFNGKNFSTYNPEEHWLRVAFNDVIPKIYVNHKDVYRVTDDPVPIAVADIIRVLAMLRVTDIYGPIPYSQIGQDGNLNAPYDSQEQVYTQMFKELDNAIAVLTEHRTENFSPKADRVYKGNVEKWIKLANSAKLRMAIRTADVSADAQKKAEEAVSHIVGVMTTNDDNAFINSVPKNPLRVVMYEYNGGDSRISADITSYMNGYKDPRRDKYFTKSTFTATGITNNYVGLRSGIQIPAADNIRQYSNANVEADSKIMWMNAAECAFLRAEGALRGWNMGSPAISAATAAEGFYKTGISLSFEQWGVSGAGQYAEDTTSKPEVYIDPLGNNSYTGSPSSITIKWNESNNFALNLEQIITQKWIANFPLGIEAWSEYRRTGYPKLMEVKVNNSGGKVDSKKMARRLPYPQNEYTENGANVSDAVSKYLKGPDNMGTDVWWARK